MSKEYERLQKARSMERLIGSELLASIIDDFHEFHGDRFYGDDSAIIGGIGFLRHLPVTIIAQDKGKEIADRQEKNYGMPHPEGYRKAQRLIAQAEKFNRPIITIVDTPGAYPGIEAEERGQGEAIAQSIMQLTGVKVPVITILISEGGSGGALALAVNDHMYMFENAYYSVISPEGFASILLKDGSKAKEVVPMMKIQSDNLKEFGVIDEIIQEPEEGINIGNLEPYLENLKTNLVDKIEELQAKSAEELLEERYARFDKFGREQ